MTSEARLYYFRQKGIYPSIKRYIPFRAKVYTFLAVLNRCVEKAFGEAVPFRYFASPRVMRKEAL